MQFPQSLERSQLPLFEAIWAQPTHFIHEEIEDASEEAFSEIVLRGAAGNCLHLLAPILRELSQAADARWLTLVATPSSVTHAWLKDAGLNRERILLLHSRDEKSALQLACEALRLGRSHTVVTWLPLLERHARHRLSQSALQGSAQSLNIRLG